jgi:hypothetical protein
MDELIAALQNEDSNVRRVAAEALGGLGYPRAVEPLIVALRDEDPHVRRAAAEALGNIGDARAVKFLIMALHDDNRHVRRTAVVAVGKIRDPRAVEPLIIALRDEDSYVRQTASEVLGNIRDARAVEPLIMALRSEDSYVRQTASEVLGNIGDARAVEPLFAALRDEEWSVREAAVKALGEIGDVRALELLVKPSPIVSETWRAYALVELSPRLAELGHPKEALAAVRTIGDEGFQVEALTRLFPYLPERLVLEALVTAREISSGQGRARMLAELAPRLAEMGHPYEGLATVRTIEDDEYRLEALARLVPYLPVGVLLEALVAAQEIREEKRRAEALVGLAPHLPEGLLQEALSAARAIEHEEYRAEALAGLAPYLPKGLLQGVVTGDRFAIGSVPPAETFAVAQIEGLIDKDVPLVVNQEYRLLAGVLSNIPTEFVGVPVELPDVEVVEIDVVVRTTGMEVLPYWMQQLRFFRGRDSGLLEFRLSPRETGQRRIFVEFYYQRHWLAEIQFEVDVVEAPELVTA